MNVDKMKNDLFTLHPSAENIDIQNGFYLWFEEKGLINKLRAHIREQMISALKYNPTWSTNVTSPKIQAINLLVADFLLNQENVFTLSVFVTEVPLLYNVQEFSTYINRIGNSIQSKSVAKPRFQLNDIHDILEALYIQSTSDVTELTCQYYFNDNDNRVHSLLACLFKAIKTVKNNPSKYCEVQSNENCLNKYINNENDTYEHKLNKWLTSVEDILSSLNLNEKQRNILKKLLKKFYQNNSNQEATIYKERLKKLEKQYKEINEKAADIEQMLATYIHSHTCLMFQKKQVEQKHCSEQQLYQEQIKLHKLEEEYNEKLRDVENQKYELKLKEIEIMRREKMLKEESMKQYIYENKIIESNQVKSLQEIKSKLEKLEDSKNENKTNSKNVVDNDCQRIEFSLDKEIIRKLQKENDEMREFIKVQRQRIEELSNRASNLAKQIEKTHQPSSTITDYQTRNMKKKLNFVNDFNRKRYNNQNISSTTTDHSTTVLETEDDMIQEAHLRLKMLEINTAKVEQNLKNYYTNRMRYNNEFKAFKKKSYNKFHSNLSDDSDFGTLKNNSNKVNLKELANKIGYHRSIRQSINNSPTENDTNPEILQNNKLQNSTNLTTSPTKMLPCENNMYKISPISSPKINFPITTKNDNTKLSTNISIASYQSPKKNELTSKKAEESDHTISCASNKTDKSSDFWA